MGQGEVDPTNQGSEVLNCETRREPTGSVEIWFSRGFPGKFRTQLAARFEFRYQPLGRIYPSTRDLITTIDGSCNDSGRGIWAHVELLGNDRVRVADQLRDVACRNGGIRLFERL